MAGKGGCQGECLRDGPRQKGEYFDRIFMPAEGTSRSGTILV